MLRLDDGRNRDIVEFVGGQIGDANFIIIKTRLNVLRYSMMGMKGTGSMKTGSFKK